MQKVFLADRGFRCYYFTCGMKHTIAIVDDEKNLAATILYALEKEGYAGVTYDDGESAWNAFRKKMPDLAVLDIVMPGMDGMELCRRIRARSESLPIIFLTSRDEEFDRVLGLEIGADDYLCKPFSMRELMTRIKVLFRRLCRSVDAEAETLVTVDDLVLDCARYTATYRGKAVPLTVTEFLLLKSLVVHPGHVKNREILMNEIYPPNTFVSDRTVDSHVKRLRRKIEESDPTFDRIEAVYGIGYRYRS